MVDSPTKKPDFVEQIKDFLVELVKKRAPSDSVHDILNAAHGIVPNGEVAWEEEAKLLIETFYVEMNKSGLKRNEIKKQVGQGSSAAADYFEELAKDDGRLHPWCFRQVLPIQTYKAELDDFLGLS